MALNSAVILAGCGHMDGSEIREAVLVMLELDRHNVNFKCFAPNKNQKQVVDHKKKESVGEVRNILVESARIARGSVYDIEQIRVEEFDMLVIPGGYGVAKNFSNLFDEDKENDYILPEFKNAVREFYNAKKPIGAVCISPAVVVALLKDIAKVKVTIGEDSNGLIDKMGGVHVDCPTIKSVKDDVNRIFSCSAYMRNDSLYNVYLGIQDMISSMVNYLKSK
ncbi:es1 family protein [Ehrlichia chaffeensis str. Heartland]|uniref:Es1 family protein n=2 Tax=Ehrlichia chaffeensis (strain ATCC CRL-10679 / Arkansas) TaxID=205920 RepID=Q2GI86_EHRCR|nr:isoprenoid biosynthesis glyoxalase ElbB [Ehrlichia chaffeensis]ABD45436.1 Es1 family protein [Ehrlichia chaffeensis str. Arkansas]AHX03197.1 es1 family protein [Ehrlichia chaffeensis str. Heartland]AHX05113.1 es1 family protein [Ehrlichia chaffeensis str. Jax]AHX06102.1 es1 family protein [Ehrlichia chaffeensis str. Liberty]AHX07173.1 es1 family protein [Ehrlichia chaffeensis str. Osceola]